ncbi:MAG TPA: PIG-L family deacetylase [Acidimicrobiia bacterium]|jgi:LmbE family N-acetylglucosaminyl deacetylase|nr:PIG-L family deacetylase [Acidimicrobiia bacterium]
MSVAEPERMRDDSFPMRAWGLPEPGELDRIVIVSPHLDDAVLGCARFMAVHPGVTVVTVFAGNPDAYPVPMRTWDVQSGFGPDDDVMAVRRAEDRAALAHVDAIPLHLGFIEHSYNPGDRPVAPDLIADGLVRALTDLDPTLVVAPFGLANPDHDVTHRGSMLARDRMDAAVSWWCYEDNGYKHIPGMLAWRVSSLFRRGLWPTPVCPAADPLGDRKAAAVACYPSQLLALEDDWQIGAKLDAPAPEQFWRLAPPPPGWEGIAAD